MRETMPLNPLKSLTPTLDAAVDAAWARAAKRDADELAELEAECARNLADPEFLERERALEAQRDRDGVQW